MSTVTWRAHFFPDSPLPHVFPAQTTAKLKHRQIASIRATEFPPPPSHLTDKVPLLTFEPSKILFYNVCLLRSTPCVVLRRRNGIVLAALSCKGWIKSSVNELAAIPVTLQKRAFFFSFFFSITLFSLLLRFPFVSALNSSDHTFHTIFVVNEAKRFLPVIIELLLSGIWVLPFCLATCKTSAFLPASSF